MVTPITVTDLQQSGRPQVIDKPLPPISYTYNADFSAASIVTIDFTLINQNQQYGTTKTLFMDNGSNPEPVEVLVSITDQFFTIPAFAQGYFKIDSNIGSNIQLETVGGATDKVTVTVFNYEIPGVVWYSFGPTNIPNPLPVNIANGNDVAQGSTTDAAWNGSAGAATVISILKSLYDRFANVVVSNFPSNQGAYTDRSIASLSGASETLMPANANRRVLVISNVSANPIGVNLTGGVAAIGAVGTLTIAASASLTISDYPPNSAITVIGTAAGVVVAYEG